MIHRLAQLTLACTLVLVTVFAASTALAQTPDDWRAKDVKGRTVNTSAYRGRVMLVFVNSPALKGQLQPVTEKMVLRYGGDPRIAQVTLVDLSEAPLTWRAAESISGKVTDETIKAHDWTVNHIQRFLKRNKRPKIPGLSRKLHIILDWEGELIPRYKPFDPQKHITLVVLDAKGKQLGAFRTHQLDAAFATIDAALGRLGEGAKPSASPKASKGEP